MRCSLASVIAAAWVGGGCGFTASGQADGAGGVAYDAHLASTFDAAVVDAVPTDAAIDAPPTCRQDTVTASKVYLTSTVTDGTLSDDPAHRHLVIPSVLALSLGNAGNHCAELDFKRSSDNTTVRCRYRGGADVAHVGLNPIQIFKGREYVFDQCTLGAACPSLNGTVQTIAVDDQVPITNDITVKINNGDDQAGPTYLRQTITRCP